MGPESTHKPSRLRWKVQSCNSMKTCLCSAQKSLRLPERNGLLGLQGRFGALLLGRFLPKLGGAFGRRHFFTKPFRSQWLPRNKPSRGATLHLPELVQRCCFGDCFVGQLCAASGNGRSRRRSSKMAKNATAWPERLGFNLHPSKKHRFCLAFRLMPDTPIDGGRLGRSLGVSRVDEPHENHRHLGHHAGRSLETGKPSLKPDHRGHCKIVTAAYARPERTANSRFGRAG